MESPSNVLTESIDQLTRRIEEIEVNAIENSDLSNLTRRQIYYLGVINQMGNPTLSELALQLKLSKPSITAIVDKMVKGGYLERVSSDSDRRVSHLHLADKGKEIARLHDDIHFRIEQLLTRSLEKDEIKQLTHLLQKALKG